MTQAGVSISTIDIVLRTRVGTATHVKLDEGQEAETILGALRGSIVSVERALSALDSLIV